MVSRAPGLSNVGIKGRGNAMVSLLSIFITIDIPNNYNVYICCQGCHCVEMTVEVWAVFCAALQTPYESCVFHTLFPNSWP